MSKFNDEQLCECEKGQTLIPHACPFLVEICDNETTLCTCCEECEHQCAMDI